MPKRIQRKRTRGWRMPGGSIYVGRGSVWGNPFVVGSQSGIFDGKDGRSLGVRDQVEVLVYALSLDRCLEFYEEMVQGFIVPEMYPFGHDWLQDFARRVGGHPAEMIRSLLRGKDLVCWCPLDHPCHADVLLELANK